MIIAVPSLFLGPFFESFGAVEELVVLWRTFDAFMLVWAGDLSGMNACNSNNQSTHLALVFVA